MEYDDTDPEWKSYTMIKDLLSTKKMEGREIERKDIDTRSHHMNLNRKIHAARIENEYYDTYANADVYQKDYSKRVRADLDKVKEIDQERNKVYNQIKMRQMIRINTPELRDLEMKLRTAYVTKELKAQLAEKEAMKLAEKIEKKTADGRVTEALLNCQVAEQRERDKEKKRQMEYRKDLQDQMIFNYQLKQNKYEEFLQEKKYLDSILERIYDEDQREKEMKMCKMKKTQEEITAFKKAQEIWKEQERKRLEEENVRLQIYLRQKLDEEDARLKAKLEKEILETEFKEKMAVKLYEKEKVGKDRQDLIEDLQAEEYKQKQIEKELEDLKKVIREKIETHRVLQVQKEERRERLQREEAEDRLYRMQMLEKMENDEKLEQMSANNRRRKMIQLRRDIEDEIQNRRARRAVELKELLHMEEQEKILEEEKRKIIEEERIRMLKEHAHNLIGYIPPGVLKPDDIEHLGADVVIPKSGPCP